MLRGVSRENLISGSTSWKGIKLYYIIDVNSSRFFWIVISNIDKFVLFIFLSFFLIVFSFFVASSIHNRISIERGIFVEYVNLNYGMRTCNRCREDSYPSLEFYSIRNTGTPNQMTQVRVSFSGRKKGLIRSRGRTRYVRRG